MIVYLVLLLQFVIFVLPPLLFAAMAGTILFLIGRSRRCLLSSVLFIVALGYAGEVWLIHWIGTPNTPDLTEEQAAAILRSRPEFKSQGRTIISIDEETERLDVAGHVLLWRFCFR